MEEFVSLEEATIMELADELLGRSDRNEELAAAYHSGRFDLKALAKEIGVDEFRRVAESL